MEDTKKKTPCYDCTKRSQDCHSNCEAYAAYRAELDEKNRLKFEAKQQERLIDDYLADKHSKLKRKFKKS